MALIRLKLHLDAEVAAVWSLITDWPAHGRWIPFTKVSIDADSPVQSGLGTRFTGRSGIGPVAFDDPMTVTQWDPPQGNDPGRCRIVKHGKWVQGWAEIEVARVAGRAELSWTEEARPRWTPRFADPVVARLGKVLFGGTLRRMAAELAESPAERTVESRTRRTWS
jgi:hypothetical protein